MSDESYMGYANRETWVVSLWLSSDEGFYERVQELVTDVRKRFDDYEDQKYDLREMLESYWLELTDPDNWEAEAYVNAILPMVQDVGSVWRVDWTELALNELSE
jgi:hypothetical protein